MKLLLNKEEFEYYRKIQNGECPNCCAKCLIYKLGLACGDRVLEQFKRAGNEESIILEEE